MQLNLWIPAFVSIMALTSTMLAAQAVSDSPPDGLASVESFSSIGDTAARSAAIFTELGKVLTHPRCLNCHPAGDRPRQGDTRRLHQPPVERGADGHGLPALRCPICHGQANFDPAGMPGNPIWHLAPREMAWETDPSTRSLSISARTISSVGLGRPDTAGDRLPAPRRKRARWSRRG
jgi:hypothetical protein